ncbi:TetR/AcrR family transcriptional regulator [Streptomyces sp. NPDC004980]
MSPRRSESRDRMILSAAALPREYGASATSIDRVLAHSGSPGGSVYHHLPGGRAQLIDEAVALALALALAGDFIAGLIDAAIQADDPVEAVDAFFVLWHDRLAESGFRAGCPIVAVAVETNDDAPQLARSAAAVFARWQEALAALLIRHGLTEERSRRLGNLHHRRGRRRGDHVPGRAGHRTDRGSRRRDPRPASPRPARPPGYRIRTPDQGVARRPSPTSDQ